MIFFHYFMIIRFIACICVAAALSQAAEASDLLEVYRVAEERDPRFRAVLARERATEEQYPQARAQLLPSIRFNANVARNFQDVTIGSSVTAFGGGRFDFTGELYTLNITQPVFHYDRWVQLKQADARIQQAAAEVDAARHDLMIRVVERYLGVLAAIDNLEFARAEREALQRQLDQATARFEVGVIAITDVQEARAARDRATAQEIEAQNQLDKAHDALRELTGQYYRALNRLRAEVPLIPPEPSDIERWTATALSQNLRIVAARLAAQDAREEIGRQNAGHLPTLDLVGTHLLTTTGGRFGDVDTETSAIGVEINVPIFEGGLVSSRAREAGHRYTVALETVEQETRATQREARDAYLGVITGISRVQALKQAVVSTQTAVEATEAGFEVGTRTSVDVVAAQRALFRAKRDYSQARYDYLLDSLRLKRAASSLAVADLAKVNAWLGP